MTLAPDKRSLGLVFHDDEYAYLKRVAAERRVSVGQVVRELVRACMRADSAECAMTVPPSQRAAD